ncbi:SCO3933 family regulatory protein [Streptomyces sp. NPDC057062]|uniref:SCO3933 family regulatory protein n=1 Tax=Streptomyces sp. NPDC057062 TaxID=3346011 RepID=UPI00363EB1B3
MRQIPVDTSAATVMVAKTPQPKVKDRRTGEIATDAETGAKLMTVDVMFAANDEVEILSVTVPEPGISGELAMGTPVALTGLIARPWENDFNGQKRHGIAFRAVAVTSLAVTGSTSKAA